MKLKDIIEKNRSYRRFHQDFEIDFETLRGLIELARHTASAANRQPLKYILSCDAKKNALIFPHLAWAGYLKDWPGPADGERPSAYVVVLGDKRIQKFFGHEPGTLDQDILKSVGCDHGIAAQNILLGAVEKGLGGCIIGAFKREKLMRSLNVEDHFEILFVIALGKPNEIVEIEPMGQDGDFRYWRDDQGKHHVPKRSLDDIIVK